MILQKKAYFRFYEELNDFLAEEKRKIKFEYKFFGRASVKDMIEALGVPHTEVDLILVNGKSVDFPHIVKDEDEISVYPEFESFDISEVQHLRPEPLRNPKFIADVHLGTLARYLRMLGIDVLYKNDFKDEEIVKISLAERRAILTKDRGILKRSEVTHGYFVRSEFPKEQLKEVIERFHLKSEVKEFSRCLNCNSFLEKANKEEITNRIPPKVAQYQDEFFICRNCDKIYWKGSHFDKMKKLIEEVLNED